MEEEKRRAQLREILGAALLDPQLYQPSVIPAVAPQRRTNFTITLPDGPRRKDETRARWDAHPVLRLAKVIAEHHARIMVGGPRGATDEDMTTGDGLRKKGCTPAKLEIAMRRSYPIVFQVYLELTGKELTGDILFNRVDKMWRLKKHRMKSTEHPDIHWALKPTKHFFDRCIKAASGFPDDLFLYLDPQMLPGPGVNPRSIGKKKTK